MPKNKAEETEAVETQAESTEESSVVETVAEAVTSAVETVVETVSAGAAAVVEAIAGDEKAAATKGKRAERIGIVTSDKMTKTVVVIVDRKVKHPIYRKYVRKSKKFMAHDETGAKIGDRVRIIETRPLSARKRWRVVEIIQKAAV